MSRCPKRGKRYIVKARSYRRYVRSLQCTVTYVLSQFRKYASNGLRVVSSFITNSPSAILAWIFSAAVSAARLLVPTRLALRLPLWSMKSHQAPLCCLTLTDMVTSCVASGLNRNGHGFVLLFFAEILLIVLPYVG